MLLGFKTQHAGKPTNFPAKILLSDAFKTGDNVLDYQQEAYDAVNVYEPKLHTIRADPHDRWQAGKTIHFATGVRTKNMRQFGTAVCTGTQPVLINGLYELAGSRLNPKPQLRGVEIRIGVELRLLDQYNSYRFVINDGFENTYEFLDWFEKDINAAPSNCLQLKLIHWTDLRY